MLISYNYEHWQYVYLPLKYGLTALSCQPKFCVPQQWNSILRINIYRINTNINKFL